jgi:hypothetical protein
MKMMINLTERTFPGLYERFVRLFNAFWTTPHTCKAQEVPVSTWHAKPTDMPSIELAFVNYEVYIPPTKELLVAAVKPNLPWAEDHFQERVSGDPLNPPPSEAYWPFAVKGNEAHKADQVFSHTYPERYWPKKAGYAYKEFPHRGIRYDYGDLEDVITLLSRDLLTRQAYLPVWFPEDTGAVDGQRVPCSLGYHFLVRQEKLYCTYVMRSCDFLRHWADDMYLTARLMQYVAECIMVSVGSMICQISSLHIFAGDKFMMSNLMGEIDEDYETTAF